MAKTPEGRLKAKAIPMLKSSGLLWWRNNSGMMPISFPGQKARFMQVGTRGLPDIMLIGADGALWCVELKSESGKLSDSQKEFRDKLYGTKCAFFVVRTAEQMATVISCALSGTRPTQEEVPRS